MPSKHAIKAAQARLVKPAAMSALSVLLSPLAGMFLMSAANTTLSTLIASLYQTHPATSALPISNTPSTGVTPPSGAASPCRMCSPTASLRQGSLLSLTTQLTHSIHVLDRCHDVNLRTPRNSIQNPKGLP